MRTASRTDVFLGAFTILVIGCIWLLPPVGFTLGVLLLIVLPPWGRTLSERAVISGVVLLGLIALFFPRAGSTPITPMSAHVAMSILLLLVWVLRSIPACKSSIPRPKVTDGLLALLAIGTSWWLLSAYIGQSAYSIVSGLFFSGWDNEGHFVPFANTYESGSTTWPTVDGSIAWNQHYPALHTTLWSLAQLGFQKSSDLVERPDLLWPYVLWSALSFAFCLAALAWVAGDLAGRLTHVLGPRNAILRKWSAPMAILIFASFALLGSPTGLFNNGFTNFMMGVSVVVVTSYLGARTWGSARTLGWFLIPLGSLAAIGLWTPLALGLAPAGVIVALALWRFRWWVAPLWVISAGLLLGGIAWLQLKAVVINSGTDAGSMIDDLGAVGQGMNPFNIGAAIASPFIATGLAILLIRSKRFPMALSILGPVAGFVVFGFVTVRGADFAGVSRLESYYVLKTLNAMLLAVAPLIAAMVAIGIGATLVVVSRATRHGESARSDRINIVIASAMVATIGVTGFGYVGMTTHEITGGFSAAPGIEAGNVRAGGVANNLIGEAIIVAVNSAKPYPDKTPMLWDGSGTLPNLWIGALHGVMAKSQNNFYANLPPFPYDDAKTTWYLNLALNVDPALDIALLWFREVSGVITDRLQVEHPDRITSVRMRMRSSALCEECSL